MIYRDFQDLKLSALGLGTMRLPVMDGDDSKIDTAAAEEMIGYAMEHGINYYDTAWGYHDGHSETVVGEALAFGAPLAEALEGQAHVIRDEQRAQVEERIERVPVKMLIPLGTLVVPAMFLAVLGPLLGSVMG